MLFIRSGIITPDPRGFHWIPAQVTEQAFRMPLHSFNLFNSLGIDAATSSLYSKVRIKKILV